jgi:hypothetical protein
MESSFMSVGLQESLSAMFCVGDLPMEKEGAEMQLENMSLKLGGPSMSFLR